jgi:hypothetical protein
MSALAQIENKLNNSPSLKAALMENFVEERFVTNFEAVTGRKDGKTKFQSTFLSYMERIAEKQELVKASRFSHFAAIVKIGRMGLPLEKLYIMPDGHGGIKVQSDPAGKRLQLEMMEDIEEVPEPQVVFKGEEFVHDKLNNIIKEHKSKGDPIKFTLDDILCSYVRIKKKNGKIIDVVVYHQDLTKAKAKSPAKSDQAFWNTFPAEASKKVAINRAHGRYHNYPDNVVSFGDDDESDDTDKSKYQEANVQDDFITPAATEEVQDQQAEVVDQDTGEVTKETPTEEVKLEEKKSKAGKQESFI